MEASDNPVDSNPSAPSHQPKKSHWEEILAPLAANPSSQMRIDFLKDTIGCLVTLLAFFAFIGFMGIIAFLLMRGTMDNSKWVQYTYLMSGLETITFTAIGWLFGKEVHRQQAQQAERRADLMEHMAMEAMQTVANEAKRADIEKMKRKMLEKGVMDHAHERGMQPLVAMVKSFYPEMSEEA